MQKIPRILFDLVWQPALAVWAIISFVLGIFGSLDTLKIRFTQVQPIVEYLEMTEWYSTTILCIANNFWIMVSFGFAITILIGAIQKLSPYYWMTPKLSITLWSSPHQNGYVLYLSVKNGEQIELLECYVTLYEVARYFQDIPSSISEVKGRRIRWDNQTMLSEKGEINLAPDHEELMVIAHNIHGNLVFHCIPETYVNNPAGMYYVEGRIDAKFQSTDGNFQSIKPVRFKGKITTRTDEVEMREIKIHDENNNPVDSTPPIVTKEVYYILDFKEGDK